MNRNSAFLEESSPKTQHLVSKKANKLEPAKIIVQYEKDIMLENKPRGITVHKHEFRTGFLKN